MLKINLHEFAGRIFGRDESTSAFLMCPATINNANRACASAAEYLSHIKIAKWCVIFCTIQNLHVHIMIIYIMHAPPNNDSAQQQAQCTLWRTSQSNRGAEMIAKIMALL